MADPALVALAGPAAGTGALPRRFRAAGRTVPGIGTALLAAARAEWFTHSALSPGERSMPFSRRSGSAPAASVLLAELDR